MKCISFDGAVFVTHFYLGLRGETMLSKKYQIWPPMQFQNFGSVGYVQVCSGLIDGSMYKLDISRTGHRSSIQIDGWQGAKSEQKNAKSTLLIKKSSALWSRPGFPRAWWHMKKRGAPRLARTPCGRSIRLLVM